MPLPLICKVDSTSVGAQAFLVSPGLYQINLTMPPKRPNGDILFSGDVNCSYGGNIFSGRIVTPVDP